MNWKHRRAKVQPDRSVWYSDFRKVETGLNKDKKPIRMRGYSGKKITFIDKQSMKKIGKNYGEHNKLNRTIDKIEDLESYLSKYQLKKGFVPRWINSKKRYIAKNRRKYPKLFAHLSKIPGYIPKWLLISKKKRWQNMLMKNK